MWPGSMTRGVPVRWPSREPGCWRSQQLAPELRLRRNYPYQGRGDGLTASLRKHHPDAAYVGIELEVNQRFVEQARRRLGTG